MGVTGHFTDNSGLFIREMESKRGTALRAVGERAAGYARDLCPVDTGRLRESIRFTVGGDEVEIGTDVEYAPYVELGTRKQRAQPFLTPALEDHVDEYLELIKDVLRSD